MCDYYGQRLYCMQEHWCGPSAAGGPMHVRSCLALLCPYPTRIRQIHFHQIMQDEMVSCQPILHIEFRRTFLMNTPCA